jgi:glycosyltransferase involved in cell wall biosynthesis
MPQVSVLIPAYKTTFLDLAIASVLAQTYRDFELIVSDDSEGHTIEELVDRWAEPRVKYLRNPNPRVPGANRDYLISRANGKYLKFLFDDDFLLPRSLEVLRELASVSGAKLTFHGRHAVGPDGSVRSPLRSLLRAGQVAEITPQAVFDGMIGTGINFIGEPSNILIDADTLRSMDRPFAMQGERMRFLTDVALYLNFAIEGHKILGIGTPLSAFRLHDQQLSQSGGPIFGAGLFEWEYLARLTADLGHLEAKNCTAFIIRLHERYREEQDRYPELALLAGLPVEPGASGFLSPVERDAFAEAWAIVDERTSTAVPRAVVAAAP